jgi:hypothetical protein
MSDDLLARLDALVSWTVSNDSGFRAVWPGVLDALKELRDIADWKPGYYDNRDNQEAESLRDRAADALSRLAQAAGSPEGSPERTDILADRVQREEYLRGLQGRHDELRRLAAALVTAIDNGVHVVRLESRRADRVEAETAAREALERVRAALADGEGKG